ncbi:premnaspirodiene oxygenase [Phtheirospermum japonicum]|uniref:Premnaspirodiene oxygenase n=1 Tax=Phtheirospermum japonicum TaxID=374723 RepID=A0A830C0E1_9LAMI|nr:premnaspirodiene oxygenase [Phtheirospermum japonicum]
MELEFSSFLFLLSFLAFLFIRGKLGTYYKPKLLPPGPWNLPFIGNLHLFAGSNPPHHTLKALAKKYGPLMHLKLGEVDTIIVSSPEIAKELLKTHDIVFAARPSLLVAEISCYGNTDVAFAPYGEYWRQLRKICTLELLSARRVLSFRQIREDEVSGLCKWIAMQAGSPINLTQRLGMTNNDIIARAALGNKTNDKSEFISVVRESVKFFSVFHSFDAYPSIKLFRLISASKRKIEKLHRQSDRIIGKIINERKRDNFARIDKGEKQNDLLDVLLEIQGAGSLDLPLTIDNIKAVLVEMFGAGTETSTVVVDWAMAEMLRNPRVLQKAQDEVRQVFDGKQNLSESYIDELKYLKLVIKETLRLHPPTPLIPRESRDRCEINGYEITAGTRVLVNAFAIGRDPEYWEDAKKFKPERFLEKSVDFRANSFEYIPFGAGRRICPGITFGMANVELPLAMILYHFDWTLPDGMKPGDLKMTELFGFTSRRKHDLCVVPAVKRPLLANSI